MAYQQTYYHPSWGYWGSDPHDFDNPHFRANQYQPSPYFYAQQTSHPKASDDTIKPATFTKSNASPNPKSCGTSYCQQTIPQTVTNLASKASTALQCSTWVSPDRSVYGVGLQISSHCKAPISSHASIDFGRASLSMLEQVPRQYPEISSLELDVTGNIDGSVTAKIDCLCRALSQIRRSFDSVAIKKAVLGPFTQQAASVIERSRAKSINFELDCGWMPNQQGIVSTMKSLQRTNPSRVTLICNGAEAFADFTSLIADASTQNSELALTCGVSELYIAQQPIPSTHTRPYYLESLQPLLSTIFRNVKVLCLKQLYTSFQSLARLHLILADHSFYACRIAFPRFIIGCEGPEVTTDLNCQHWLWVEESLQVSVLDGEYSSIGTRISVGGNGGILVYAGGAILSIGRQRMVIPYRRLACKDFASIVKTWEEQLKEMNLEFESEAGKDLYRYTDTMDVKLALYHLVTSWAFTCSSNDEKDFILQAGAHAGLVAPR